MSSSVDRETVARDRVSNGSRRKRDLASVDGTQLARRLERRQRILNGARSTPTAAEAWATVRKQAQDRLPTSTWTLWLEPVELAGEYDGALVLIGPDAVATWVERRYGCVLGDEVRAASDYRGVFVLAGDRSPSEGDGCL